MTTVKLNARAYLSNHDGKSLYVESNRTDNYILIREKWFDGKTLDLYHRVILEAGKVLATPVLFDKDEVQHLWKVYRIQQRARGKRLFPAKGI